MKKGDQSPVEYDGILPRTKDVLLLLDKAVVNDDDAPVISDAIQVGAYRHFLLFIEVTSTGTPTTIRYEVQFLNVPTGKWHTYKQGLFAALYYEDTDTADGVCECFHGDCVGREMRVKATVADGSSSAYFTTSVGVELWN